MAGRGPQPPHLEPVLREGTCMAGKNPQPQHRKDPDFNLVKVTIVETCLFRTLLKVFPMLIKFPYVTYEVKVIGHSDVVHCPVQLREGKDPF